MGTAERLGKLVVLGSNDSVASGRPAFCQILLSEPLPALRGDHFIVRDETAQRTLGGGIVLHPSPPVHSRGEPELETRLHILQAGDPATIAAVFLDEREEFASTIAPIHQFLNLRAEEAAERLRGVAAIKVVPLDGEDFFTTERKWTALKAALVSALREFHTAHPLEPGQDMEVLREKLHPVAAPRMFRAFVESLEAERAIVREGSLLRLPDHRVALGQEQRLVAEKIKGLLARSPLAPPDVPQMARETGIDRARLVPVIRVLERERSVVKVAADLYLLCDAVDLVVRTLREEWAERDDITPALFRDRFNTTRKYAIPLLEYLDAAGVTVRIGDRRRLKTVRSVRL
jgi:selenocysteine-specific elongation factor